MQLMDRIKRIENILFKGKENTFPGNKDGFITALGLDKEKFEKPGGGYDFIEALNETAAEDWK